MKLLLDPVYTHIYPSKCSTYFALKNAGLNFLKKSSRFVYCNVPDENYKFNKFINDDLVENPRWLNIPCVFGTDRYQNNFFVPEDYKKFARFNYFWDWDILMTTRNNGWYWRLLSKKSWANKLLILIEPFPIMGFKKGATAFKWLDVNTLNSYLAFDYIFIQTQWEKDKIIETAQKHFSPSNVLKLMEKLIVCFPKPEIDYNYFEKKKLKDKFQLVYIQRLDEAERRVKKMLNVLRKAFILSNDDIEISISTNSERSVSHDVGFINFNRLPRNEFYDLLKGADAFLTWSVDEGMPFALLEAIAFGVIPIAKREKWSEDFLGKDYFGLVNSLEEAITLIKFLKNDREGSRKKFNEWYLSFKERIVEKRGNQNEVAEKIYDNFEEKMKKNAFKMTRERTLADLINSSERDIIEVNPRVPLDIEGVRAKKRPEDFVNVPFARLADFYPDKIRLIYKYHWLERLEPGIFERNRN